MSSLGDAAVGCPERAQVGPLPWLSKSRLGAGIWSAVRTPGSLSIDCWATRPVQPRPSGSVPMLRGLFRRRDLNLKLLQELRVDSARGVEHEVLHALRLGECDHVADVVGAREQHDDAVDPRRDSPVRWHAVLERLEEETETLVDGHVVQTKELKHALLQLGFVNPQASARELVSIAHRVVRMSAHVVRPLIDEL